MFTFEKIKARWQAYHDRRREWWLAPLQKRIDELQSGAIIYRREFPREKTFERAPKEFDYEHRQ